MSEFLDCRDYSKKVKNPVYNTFLGDYDQKLSPTTNERSILEYQRWCFYGKLKISYSKIDLKDDWIHRSIHWNNVNNGGIAWNFHIAYKSKYPFIKIGFNSIKNLFKQR